MRGTIVSRNRSRTSEQEPPMNEHNPTVASGPDPATAWRALCEQLGALGDEAAAVDPAVGVRHLARLVALALEEQLEHADTRHPSFVRYEAPWSQWGAPNPDNVYVRTAIDPAATYRVRANVAGVRQILVSLVEGDMQLDEYGVYSERALHELDVAPDGTLELFVSPEEHAGNWLRSVPSSRLLMVRQYQYDWEHDPIATFEIERLDTRGEPAPSPGPLAIAAAIERAARWVERSLHYWAPHSLRDGGAPPNTIGAPATPPGGAPHIAYAAGQWSLASDEALLVTTDVPDADYWNWVAHNRHWFDSGDFASRQTSLNQTQVHIDGDGRVRLVVAGVDPGVPNWIDTSGQPAGMLAYRLIGARSKPAPSAQIVPHADVRAQLPVDHPIIDAATRRDVLARRRAAVLRRYR
jgi:hypothetical protein